MRELLVLGRVLGRFVHRRRALGPLDAAGVAPVDDSLDDLLADCVGAYLDASTAELSRRARLDPLTGLLHQQAFADDLARELDRARRYGGRLSLVYADLDDFKLVNDTRGHPEGDRVLRVVAGLLRDSLRSSDIAGRVGGDEFAAVLIEAEPAAAERFAERVRDGLAGLVGRRDLPPGLGVTFGIAHAPGDATDLDALVRAADDRLLERKALSPGRRRARRRDRPAAAS